ncbi:MAG: hypothetical protein JSS25_10225 [Proteobacteria bacterium]|nr:hypothetical protein [Pseudomonadota bacterium]
MKLSRPLLSVAVALLPVALTLAGCGKKADEQATGSTKFPAAPIQSEMVKLKTEGVLPAARRASALEFWLHYKLMQATGMEQELGGEDKAIAALKAISLKFEQSAVIAQTNVPRATKLAFDGTGMDAGVMGVGYGLVGTSITGGMLSGGLSEAQVSELAAHGPIKFSDSDNSAEVNVAQDGMDTTMEQTVNNDGVTGKVKTKVHMDACPDASGKVVVTIETESQMSAGGKSSGSVKAKFKYERWLDDDAHLISPTDNGFDEQLQVSMSGTGARGNTLSVDMTRGFSRGDSDYSGNVDEHGHSIFRPDEARHTEELLKGTGDMLRIVSEVMLQGGFAGTTPPWETGRCVDLKLRSDPAKRTGAQPKTTYTIFAEPRAKKDGAPTGGTVKGTLKGAHSLSPDDKTKADAQFTYQNPEEKDQAATIDFEARSKRGVGKASLQFDTKKGGYRFVGGSGDPVNQVVCDIEHSFVLNGKLFGVEMSGGRSGSYKFVRTPNIPGLSWKAQGSYEITFPNGEDKPGTMTTNGGGDIHVGSQSRHTSGGETFTVTPVEEGCTS